MSLQGVTKHKVLVVEDEVLIADTITYHLGENGFEVVGCAISYASAVNLFQRTAPDLALIDTRLSGPYSGIDFGAFLHRQPTRIPFVYLTSQMDAHGLAAAKATFPAGYLSKPVPLNSLLTTVEVALHNAEANEKSLVVRDGGVVHRLPPRDVLYLEADHVYVRYHLVDGRVLVERSSLTEAARKVEAENFLRVHRSYVVNLTRVSGFSGQQILIGSRSIPISRSRRLAVQQRLRQG